MIRKFTAALASASLIVAAPALAQAVPSAPAPAAESLGLEGESELFGGGGDYLIGYVLLATVLAGAVFAIIEFTEDDESNYAPFPVSP